MPIVNLSLVKQTLNSDMILTGKKKINPYQPLARQQGWLREQVGILNHVLDVVDSMLFVVRLEW